MADQKGVMAISVVDVYDGVTAGSRGQAAVEADGSWRLDVPLAAPQAYRFTAKGAGAVSNEWALRVEQPFSDFTDFSNNNLRGWKINNDNHFGAGKDTSIRGSSSFWFLDCPTPEKTGYKGVVISKTFSELKVGSTYWFEIKAWQYFSPGKPQAVLSLATADTTIFGPFLPTGEWVIYGGEFLAKTTAIELRVVSHEDSGEGNDYRLTTFLVKEVLKIKV